MAAHLRGHSGSQKIDQKSGKSGDHHIIVQIFGGIIGENFGIIQILAYVG